MKFLLLLAAIGGITGTIQAQTLIFNFSAEGRLKDPPATTSKPADKINIVVGDKFTLLFDSRDAVTGAYKEGPANDHNSFPLSEDDIKKLRKKLAGRITRTLDNLEDHRDVEKVYEYLALDEYSRTVIQLKTYRDKLLTAGAAKIDASPYPQIKDLCAMEDKLHDKFEPYHAKVVYNKAKQQYEISLTRTDPFTHFLLDLIKTGLKGLALTKLQLDHRYIKAWKEIRDSASRTIHYDSLIAMLSPQVFICDTPGKDQTKNIKVLRDQIDNWDKWAAESPNEILKAIRADAQKIPGFLWFNGGNFGTDLIGMTTPDRQFIEYPFDKDRARLRDSIISQKARNTASCCNVTIGAIDSLILQIGKGSERFRQDAAPDTVFGYNSVKDLRTAIRTVNQSRLQLTDLNTGLFIYNYDASDNYSTKKKDASNRAIIGTDRAIINVHNVSAGKTVSFAQLNTPSTNTSSFQDALGDVGSLFSVAKALPPSLVASLATPAVTFTGNPINPPASFKSVSSPDKFANNLVANITVKDTNGKQIKIPETQQITEKILLRQYLTVTGQEKSLPLLEFYFANCHKDAILDFNISESDGEKIIKPFKEFIVRNNERGQRIEKLTRDWHDDKAVQYIRLLDTMPDKSLPPTDLDESTDPIALFRTETDPLQVPDSTVLINYTITQKKKGSDGSPVVDTTVTGNLRVGKGLLFQFSIGIGVTTADFYQKTATTAGNTLNVAVNSNRVSYIAGLHIYWNKLFLPDDSFLGISSGHFKNRVSAYIGVGIPDALKQYYAGLGLDLLPGLKLVGGLHYFLNTRYTLANNQVVDQAMGVKYAGPFISINLDPVAIIKILGISK